MASSSHSAHHDYDLKIWRSMIIMVILMIMIIIMMMPMLMMIMLRQCYQDA